MKICSLEEAKLSDKNTIDNYVPGIILMERAGAGVYFKIKKHYGEIKNKKILVVCGVGNNGGDGFVVARYFKDEKNVELKILLTGEKEKLVGDAKLNYDICVKKNICFVKDIDEDYDIIVDAIFGIGLNRNIEGELIDIINKINNLNSFVVSIDIPSGINGDTGKIMGCAVKANLTVTFEKAKIGHFLYPGREYTGILEIVNIGLEEIKNNKNNYFALDIEEINLNPRKKTLHKGEAGKVLIIGGSLGMSGAPYMSAMGALKTGAGLITIAVPSSIHSIVASKCVEAMTLPLYENEDGTLSLRALADIVEFIKKNSPDAVVIGPGMGRNVNTLTFIKKLIENIKCVKIIDADGLFAIKDDVSILKDNNCIITPHLVEFERMSKITDNKCNDAIEFAKNNNTIVVLKGADTVISDGENVYINTTGNSGLATGGSGDVLSGMIASFVAQGYDKLKAAYLSVFIHGMAADELLENCSEEGIIPTDIINQIGKTIKKLKDRR